MNQTVSIDHLHKLFLESSGVITDTRKIKHGAIFFALVGENFDGNEFAEEAIKKGATYAVVSDPTIENENCLIFEDTLSTLQDLANFHRRYLGIPILALTGSNGKTTTKELIAQILKKRFKVRFTQGNLNNHIGVPLTLLDLDESVEFGVIEMGANHLNEIKLLSNISEPNYGLITNIGKAHIGEFGGQENIKKAKFELFDYIKANNGSFFYNSDYKVFQNEVEQYINSIAYSTDFKDNHQLELITADPHIELSLDNRKQIQVDLGGIHNFENIKAAIAVGYYFGLTNLEIERALQSFEAPNNRSQWIATEKNSVFLDAYNANPSSMESAIEYFAGLDEEFKCFILGDMFELGEYTKSEHEAIYQIVTKTGIPYLLVGKNFKDCKPDDPNVFIDPIELINELKNRKLEDHFILIKASRSMKLEQLIDYL